MIRLSALLVFGFFVVVSAAAPTPAVAKIDDGLDEILGEEKAAEYRKILDNDGYKKSDKEKFLKQFTNKLPVLAFNRLTVYENRRDARLEIDGVIGKDKGDELYNLFTTNKYSASTRKDKIAAFMSALPKDKKEKVQYILDHQDDPDRKRTKREAATEDQKKKQGSSEDESDEKTDKKSSSSEADE